MTDGLMFPKTMGMKKKQRQKHPKSIIDTRPGECFLCKLMGRQYYKQTEEHHVFYGNGDRTDSEENGLKVYLCPDCHRRAPYAVHNSDATRQLLCSIVQSKYLENHTKEEWDTLNLKNAIPNTEYDTYGNLKRGDFVKYRDILYGKDGIGEIFGFVDQENTIIVWVQDGGSFVSVPMDYIQKI